MRIVAGRWRGRRIRPPADARVRPTADRVREAWMSIVMPYLVDARVLDLFAGSGALGLEALSRGAASADLVEVSAAGVRAIRENADLLGAGAELRVHRADAMRFIEKLEPNAFDVAFADPPTARASPTPSLNAGSPCRLPVSWVSNTPRRNRCLKVTHAGMATRR